MNKTTPRVKVTTVATLVSESVSCYASQNAKETRSPVTRFCSLRRQNRRVSVRSGSAAIFHAEFHAGRRWTHGTQWFRCHDHKHVAEFTCHHRIPKWSRVDRQWKCKFRSKHSSTVLSLTMFFSYIKLIQKSFSHGIHILFVGIFLFERSLFISTFYSMFMGKDS